MLAFDPTLNIALHAIERPFEQEDVVRIVLDNQDAANVFLGQAGQHMFPPFLCGT
jgi:hypothetical protein